MYCAHFSIRSSFSSWSDILKFSLWLTFLPTLTWLTTFSNDIWLVPKCACTFCIYWASHSQEQAPCAGETDQHGACVNLKYSRVHLQIYEVAAKNITPLLNNVHLGQTGAYFVIKLLKLLKSGLQLGQMIRWAQQRNEESVW